MAPTWAGPGLFSFFDTPEVTKIVPPKSLQNFKNTPNCTCWSKQLNQKSFPRNIQYRTRPKGPLSVFSALRLFFGKKSPKGPYQFFLSFATEWMLKNPKGSPLSIFFRHCETFFEKKFLDAVEDNTLTL